MMDDLPLSNCHRKLLLELYQTLLEGSMDGEKKSSSMLGERLIHLDLDLVEDNQTATLCVNSGKFDDPFDNLYPEFQLLGSIFSIFQ